MNLSDVIEGLVEERGLDKEKVIDVVCQGVLAAFVKKFPDLILTADFNRKSGDVEVFVEKEIVSSVKDPDNEITLRKAKVFDTKADLGQTIVVPFEEKIGRIEVLTAKQVIASKIQELESAAVYKEYIDKKGLIVNGVVHKKERAGFAVKIGDVMAILPKENLVPQETPRVGHPIRALLKDVLTMPRGDYQLILDRASAEFVQRLLEAEIPEVFEGIVEVRKIVRSAGYKTKAVVYSNTKEIDAVGTCVGVGGARIKPILRELGQEKIDLIKWTGSHEELIKDSLKPAEIDKVEVVDSGKKAIIWLEQDQRSLAIGRMGQNITLASKLSEVDIQLQDVAPAIEKQEEEE